MLERKPKFRSRKIDIRKALRVYRHFEVPDLDENASASRAIPAMPTGVDKEEEEEHHLQVAITASQISSSANASSAPAPSYSIPTPEATRKAQDYELLYKSNYKQAKNLTRFSTVIEDCVSIPYDMDDEDDIWLKQHNSKSGGAGNVKAQSSEVTETSNEKSNKSSNDSESTIETENILNGDTKSEINPNFPISEDQFEMILSQLEKCANERGDSSVSVKDLEILKSMPIVSLVVENCGQILYEYWIKKRARRGGRPLTISTKPDEGPKSYTDPYVCFRRREVKGQRKTRRSDAQCLEKLKKLKADLETGRTLLEMVCKRDKFKRESLMLDALIFEQSLLVDELRKKCDPAELETISHLRPIFEKANSLQVPRVYKKNKSNVLGDGSSAGVTSTPHQHGGHGHGQVGRPRLHPKEKAARAANRAARVAAAAGDSSGSQHKSSVGGMASASSNNGNANGSSSNLMAEPEPGTIQAIIWQMEKEIARRKKQEEDQVDLSEYATFPTPHCINDLFFFEDNRSDEVDENERTNFYDTNKDDHTLLKLFKRRRLGRGGRIIYDQRRLLTPCGKRKRIEEDCFSGDKNNYFERQLIGFHTIADNDKNNNLSLLEDYYFNNKNSQYRNYKYYEPSNSHQERYLKLLKEPELSLLNNASITNYNHHYLKVTSGIQSNSNSTNYMNANVTSSSTNPSTSVIDYTPFLLQTPQIAPPTFAASAAASNNNGGNVENSASKIPSSTGAANSNSGSATPSSSANNNSSTNPLANGAPVRKKYKKATSNTGDLLKSTPSNNNLNTSSNAAALNPVNSLNSPSNPVKQQKLPISGSNVNNVNRVLQSQSQQQQQLKAAKSLTTKNNNIPSSNNNNMIPPSSINSGKQQQQAQLQQQNNNNLSAQQAQLQQIQKQQQQQLQNHQTVIDKK